MTWTPKRIKNKTCQRVEELLVSQRPSISNAQLCLWKSSCSCVTFFFGGWWHNLHTSHRKTIQSAKCTKNAKKTENPFHGNTSYAAVLQRAAHWMTGLGQSLRDPHSLMKEGKTRGRLARLERSSVCQGAAEVSSTRQHPPWFNLRRPFGWVPRMSDP